MPSQRRAIALPVVRWVHRYAGLATALFLAVAGVTGSVLAFEDELDAWLNPDLHVVTVVGEPRAPLDLAAAVERADPRRRVRSLPLRIEPGRSVQMRVVPRIDPRTGRPFALDHAVVFVDPYGGDVIGTRDEAMGLDRRHLVATLTALHSSLLLGPWGRWVMGIVALIWLGNCLLGLWLTVPRGPPRLSRWMQAWRVRPRAGFAGLNFDLHRAGGLWFWSAFLVLAISSVHLNLHDSVFRPAVSLFSRLTPSLAEQGKARLRSTVVEPALTRDAAIARAARIAVERNLPLVPVSVFWLPAYGVYGIAMAAPDGDAEAGLGPVRLFLDDQSGDLVTAYTPGEGSAGDLFLQIQFPLHSGHIAGMPGRILISGAGLAVAVSAVTGTIVWWRGLRRRRRRQPARPLGPA